MRSGSHFCRGRKPCRIARHKLNNFSMLDWMNKSVLPSLAILNCQEKKDNFFRILKEAVNERATCQHVKEKMKVERREI